LPNNIKKSSVELSGFISGKSYFEGGAGATLNFIEKLSNISGFMEDNVFILILSLKKSVLKIRRIWVILWSRVQFSGKN